MITAKEIEKQTMSEAKKAAAKNDLFAFYVGRPISYYATIPFLYIGTKPNTITFWSVLFEIMGFVICCFASTKSFQVLGWVAFFLWNIFDGVDGNIARYRKLCSPIGDILDAMGGYLAMFLTFFAVGCIGYHSYSMLDVFIKYDKFILIVLGAFSGFFTIFPRLIMHKMASSDKNSDVSEIQDHSKFSIIKVAMLNLVSAAGGAQVLMLIAILLNLADVYTICYFFLNFAVMIASLFTLLRSRR